MFDKRGLGMKTHIWEGWGRDPGGPEPKAFRCFREGRNDKRQERADPEPAAKGPRHDTRSGEVPRCCDKPSLPLCSDPDAAPSV